MARVPVKRLHRMEAKAARRRKRGNRGVMARRAEHERKVRIGMNMLQGLMKKV